MYRKGDNPPSRFPVDRPLDADLGNWRVAHVRSRCEKQFAHFLLEKGIGYYLPLFLRKTRRKDNNKTRKSICPLFPGYIAFAADAEAIHQWVLKNHDVVNVLAVKNQEKLVRELDQIKLILDRDLAFLSCAGILPGTKVVIRGGGLSGLEGVILRNDHSARLIVGVEMFGGQSISVELGASDIATLDGQ